MFSKSRKKARNYSYTDQKSQMHRIRRIILGLLIFLIVYTVMTSFVFSMVVLENETMTPNLRPGERFIFSSYNIYSVIPGLDLAKGTLPFSRGSVVLVNMYEGEKPGTLRGIMDALVRCFTAQRLSLVDHDDYIFVKRVIGLPGDEISMSNFVVRVKAGGTSYSLTEFEVTENDYVLDIPQAPALWDSTLPFSGSMDTIVLGEDECFVLSDDRNNTNDSRTWGPVPVQKIAGKALFRYWPFTRLGSP